MFRAACLAILAAGVLLVPATAQAAQPIEPDIGWAIWDALIDPGTPPPGVNNYNCKLSAAHPRPVVLIDGTFANMQDDYGALAPILENDGYCVFSRNYGGSSGDFVQSIGPVPTSAGQIASLITKVGSHYGTQVDLVGHSQGGMLAEYVTKFLGVSGDVQTIVALSPTTHGTSLDGLVTLAQIFPGANDFVGAVCHACVDQETGSAVITKLDAGAITQPGIKYTVIETRDENVVTPVGSSFIEEPGVRNEYVQSSCSADDVDHADLPYDNTTIRLVLNALSPATAKAPKCSQTYPASAVQQ
jgi:triacylglycerol esterase/lipase EstA (alpha/beta hydrolase family)